MDVFFRAVTSKFCKQRKTMTELKPGVAGSRFSLTGMRARRNDQACAALHLSNQFGSTEKILPGLPILNCGTKSVIIQ